MVCRMTNTTYTCSASGRSYYRKNPTRCRPRSKMFTISTSAKIPKCTTSVRWSRGISITCGKSTTVVLSISCMRREKFSLLVAGICLSVVTIVPTSFTADTKTGGRVQLTSPAFEQGAAIPRKHTCDADDVSPQLRWTNPPAGTKGFALIADDSDAPGGTWVHWLIYDL